MRRADAVLTSELPTSMPEPAPLVLMGRSPAARRLAEAIDAAADASCVLLEAESGLETIDIARAIHGRSGRAGRFVAVDCDAKEPSQVDRELFGLEPHPAAADVETVSRDSALARAAGGTLYLADLSELSAPAQSRLARLANSGEVRIQGATRRLDVCLIAATPANVASDDDEGQLPSDLQPHFSRSRIVVPSLRQRREDVPHLIDALVDESCRQAGVPKKSFTEPASALLAAMPWRGNLAELRQAVSRIVITSGDFIQPDDVLAHVRIDGALTSEAPAGTLRSARQQFEREYITLVLRRHRGRVSEAARALGIQRTNLYRKARQLGISVVRPVQDQRS